MSYTVVLHGNPDLAVGEESGADVGLRKTGELDQKVRIFFRWKKG